MLVGWSVTNSKKGGELKFNTPIGALVFFIPCHIGDKAWQISVPVEARGQHGLLVLIEHHAIATAAQAAKKMRDEFVEKGGKVRGRHVVNGQADLVAEEVVRPRHKDFDENAEELGHEVFEEDLLAVQTPSPVQVFKSIDILPEI